MFNTKYVPQKNTLLLECDTVSFSKSLATLRGNVAPQSSGSKSKTGKKPTKSKKQDMFFSLGLLFDPEHRQHLSPKRRWTSTGLNSVISHIIIFFIFTALISYDLTTFS
jgi:hypothetical protein